MNPIRLLGEELTVTIDPATGYTLSLSFLADEYHANLLLAEQRWGGAETLAPQSVQPEENGVTAVYESATLRMTAHKRVENGLYVESYTLENPFPTPFFLNRDTFGLRFPFDHDYRRGTDILHTKALVHLFCGEHGSYIRAKKPSGQGKSLGIVLTEGALSDYSIHYPRELPLTNYRGVFLLHPEDTVLQPGESRTLTFVFASEESGRLPVRLTAWADRYTLLQGEETPFTVRAPKPIEEAAVTVQGTPIPFIVSGCTLRGRIPMESLGEKRIDIVLNGQRTHMVLNGILSPEELLLKRAHFIAEKQQYHCPGSPLDGAYLVYDTRTGEKLYSATFTDTNASRERLSMGVIVACALQVRRDDGLYASLRAHRDFVERELFDPETATVYNEIGRKNPPERLYNYPWMSDYYLEWYRFSGESGCLVHAARILLRYYEELSGARQESVCMETYRILEELHACGMTELEQRLRQAFLGHADAILARAGNSVSEEVSCANGMLAAMVEYLSQAYLLSGEEKYRTGAREVFPLADGFCAEVPDHHLAFTAVRYWDGFWFGGIKAYGDTMPQWLSSLNGLMYYWYGRATGKDVSRAAVNNLLGALSLFSPDGSAASCYMVPYRIHIEENTVQPSKYYRPGTFHGKCYDFWANDQDWSLYYAWLLLQ